MCEGLWAMAICKRNYVEGVILGPPGNECCAAKIRRSSITSSRKGILKGEYVHNIIVNNHSSSKGKSPSDLVEGEMAEVLLLDGGMGHLLKAKDIAKFAPHLPPERQFAAAALANAAAPGLIRATHKSYIRAGCDIITTNTFGCTRWSLERADAASRQEELTALGAQIARSAADEAKRPIMVAGSVPPLGPSYTPLPDMSEESMAQEYTLICQAMAPFVDVFLCETMSSIREARIAVKAALAHPKPVWLSFTLADQKSTQMAPRLRSGETLEEAVKSVCRESSIDAILVNCCSVSTVTAAVRQLNRLVGEIEFPGLRYGGYANGFLQTTSEWMVGTGCRSINNPADFEPDSQGVWMMRPNAYAGHAQLWAQEGASIVGGCCGIGPEHMEAVKDLLGSGK